MTDYGLLLVALGRPIEGELAQGARRAPSRRVDGKAVETGEDEIRVGLEPRLGSVGEEGVAVLLDGAAGPSLDEEGVAFLPDSVLVEAELGEDGFATFVGIGSRVSARADLAEALAGQGARVGEATRRVGDDVVFHHPFRVGEGEARGAVAALQRKARGHVDEEAQLGLELLRPSRARGDEREQRGQDYDDRGSKSEHV